MTTESVALASLVANALWGLVLVNIEAVGKTRTAGTDWNMGNRDDEPPFPDWVKRAGRALSNHKENFPLFLTAVVVVHLAGKSDRVSAIAAVVYVLARIAHGLLYVSGITKVRSAAYLGGLLATFVILSRLVL